MLQSWHDLAWEFFLWNKTKQTDRQTNKHKNTRVTHTKWVTWYSLNRKVSTMESAYSLTLSLRTVSTPLEISSLLFYSYLWGLRTPTPMDILAKFTCSISSSNLHSTSIYSSLLLAVINYRDPKILAIL